MNATPGHPWFGVHLVDPSCPKVASLDYFDSHHPQGFRQADAALHHFISLVDGDLYGVGIDDHPAGQLLDNFQYHPVEGFHVEETEETVELEVQQRRAQETKVHSGQGPHVPQDRVHGAAKGALQDQFLQPQVQAVAAAKLNLDVGVQLEADSNVNSQIFSQWRRWGKRVRLTLKMDFQVGAYTKSYFSPSNIS